MYIDTHAHLYAQQFDDDRRAMIERAIAAGVEKIILPNIDEKSVDGMWQLVGDFPQHCFPAMGIHPCDVTPDVEQQMQWVREQLRLRPYVAIGETGIDMYWDKSSLRQQQQAFVAHIELAKQLALPIIIHARDSFDEIFEILDTHHDAQLRGVFHCFTGNSQQAERVLSYGLMLGIGGVLTFKSSTLAAVLEAVPLESIVLETDAPYLAPSPHRGQRNESSYLPLVARKLAEVKKTDIQTIAQQTTENATQLFRI